MEWLIMDPSRGRAFTEKLCSGPSFRGKFGGLYASVTSALLRLGATDLPVPSFIQDKIARARAVLADEERLLDIMRREADAREARVGVLRATLEKAENKDWEDLIEPQRNGRGPAAVLRFPEDNVRPLAGRMLQPGPGV